jgi:hypothetical protein
MAKKTAKAAAAKKTAKANAVALPESETIPEGFEEIGGGYSATWKPDERKVLHGPVTGGVREVELTIGRKKQTRRCMEVTAKKSGERFTVWESAALVELFDQIKETGEGPEVYLRFEGLGKKKPGQNPPKLFTVAIKA